MNRRTIFPLVAVFSTLFLTACVNFPVGTIPPPPPNVKLRVYVQPLSTAGGPRAKGGFAVSHEEYAQKQYRAVRHFLEETGIYQVVPREEVVAVIGDQKVDRDLLERSDWALAKKIGSALHAEYVMVMERSKRKGEFGTPSFVFTNIMINVETGSKFGARYEIRRAIGADYRERTAIIRRTYQEIFRNAKEDMLATALRKAERTPVPRSGQTIQAAARAEPARPVTPAAAPEHPVPSDTNMVKQEEANSPAPVPAGVAREAAQNAAASSGREEQNPEPAAGKEPAPEQVPDYIKTVREPEGLLEPAAPQGAARLVVYDLDAPEQYKPAALIISDALREELFRYKTFTLVNRENLQQVLQEMALQQTGLIDEKEAVRMGKGLAANQVVTGRLGLLGKTIMLQAKRVDVESFATLGIASERSSKDREEDILDKLPEFARHLLDTKGAHQ